MIISFTGHRGTRVQRCLCKYVSMFIYGNDRKELFLYSITSFSIDYIIDRVMYEWGDLLFIDR